MTDEENLKNGQADQQSPAESAEQQPQEAPVADTVNYSLEDVNTLRGALVILEGIDGILNQPHKKKLIEGYMNEYNSDTTEKKDKFVEYLNSDKNVESLRDLINYTDGISDTDKTRWKNSLNKLDVNYKPPSFEDEVAEGEQTAPSCQRSEEPATGELGSTGDTDQGSEYINGAQETTVPEQVDDNLGEQGEEQLKKIVEDKTVDPRFFKIGNKRRYGPIDNSLEGTVVCDVVYHDGIVRPDKFEVVEERSKKYFKINDRDVFNQGIGNQLTIENYFNEGGE